MGARVSELFYKRLKSKKNSLGGGGGGGGGGLV